MKKIFICGSISIKFLNETIRRELDNIIEKKYNVLIGDAEGIDKLVQEYLTNKGYKDVTVYYTGDKPRNYINDFNSKRVNYDEKLDKQSNKQREKQQFKDRKMVAECDISYCIWNGKSKGTYENIKKVLDSNKDIEIYLIQEKSEENLSTNNGFRELKNKIEEIYAQNNGYSLRDIYKILKEESYEINSEEKFREELERYKLIKRKKNKNKTIYMPIDEEKYGIICKYRNQISSYRYTDEFIDLVRKKLIDNGKPDLANISQNYKQGSLFS